MSSSPERTTRMVQREEAAHELHRWVRLTRCCNNRCRFCLDAASQDGRREPADSVREQIVAGRREGAMRLILSGGEPTLHPDLVQFIRLGVELGYGKVQLITNGRRFAYPRFLEACLDAGLGEITFSIHGHDAALHDELVGVPGAFEQAVAGLRAVLRDGRPVVNVDVCLNARNIPHLPALLDGFIALGVREFDLLHLIPFGRAYQGHADLLYDIDDAAESITYALRLSERPDLHIWFNRFPPPYLEGHEELIQDPFKLHDEVSGRREELERWMATGEPPACREPGRCAHCYLHPWCDALDRLRRQLAARAHTTYRVDLRSAAAARSVPDGAFAASWVRASRPEDVRRRLSGLPGDEIILEIDAYDSPQCLSEIGRARRWTRAYVERPEDLDRLVVAPGEVEVVAVLGRAMAEHLARRHPAPPACLALAYRGRERVSEAAAQDPELPEWFSRYPPVASIENLPACITGRPPRPLPAVLDADLLDGSGRLDLTAFTRHFILDHYQLKSRRCRACVHDGSCGGAHVNLVRAHGFGWLQPIGRP